MRASYITVCGLVACLVAGAAAHAQSVVVVPLSGHPGGTASLTGSGFGLSEAVDVFVDTTDTVLTVSSATGTLTTSVTIPASAQPGPHFLTAIGRRSGSAAQVAFTVTTAWAEQGFGAAHLSWNPYENTISASNVATLGELWSAPTVTLGSTPAVVSGKVYATTNAGIQALSASTGAVLWNKLAGVQFFGSPAVAGSVVYAMPINSTVLFALTTGSGATKWTQTLGGASYSSPIVVNGVVYISCNDGKVYALNATSGAILWSSVIGGSFAEAAPAVVDGVVYVGSVNNSIYALDAGTGAQLWSFATSGAVEAAPSVVNGVLYAGSDDGDVYALRTKGASPGTLLWKFATGSSVYQGSTVAGGVVYIGSQDDHIYALDAHSGALRWSFATGNIPGSAIIANKIVYVTSRDGSMYALDAGNGALLASTSLGYTYLGNPVVADGVLYLNADGGSTYALGLLAGVNGVKQPASAPRISSLHPDLSLRVTP